MAVAARAAISLSPFQRAIPGHVASGDRPSLTLRLRRKIAVGPAQHKGLALDPSCYEQVFVLVLGGLLRERKVRRARRYLPEVPVRVGEVAAIAAPRGPLCGLHDLASGARGLGDHLLDSLL